jgi:hypothetical protein
MRAIHRTIRELGPDSYEIALELTTDAPVASLSCTNLTETGSYWPLGGSGNTPNLSDGPVYYMRPGIIYPTVPTAGHQGIWHFPNYSAGGSGTVDYMGSCCQNIVRCIVSGDGTMTIHTVGDLLDRGPVLLTAWLSHANPDGSGNYVTDQTQAGIEADDDITFTIDTHGGVNCYHWVDVLDMGPHEQCGKGWGFTGMDWVSADD